MLWALHDNRSARRAELALEAASIKITAIAKLSSKDSYEQPLDAESEVQRLYYGCSGDNSYSVHIDDITCLADPVDIKHRVSSKTSDYGFREVRLSHQLFMPYWGFGDGSFMDPGELKLQGLVDEDSGSNLSLDVDVDLDDGAGALTLSSDVDVGGLGGSGADNGGLAEATRTVRTQLEQWGIPIDQKEIGCLLLPQPLLRLAQQGAWHHLLLFTDWHRSLRYCNRGGNRFCEGPIIGWPRSSAADSDKIDAQQRSEEQLTGEACRKIAANIKKWTPLITENDEDSSDMAPRWHQKTIAPKALKKNKIRISKKSQK
jgi:hypothetical protein